VTILPYHWALLTPKTPEPLGTLLMAKYVKNTNVSHQLEELIKSTADKLILIGPHLQLAIG
jgi:hypothetical protein